MKTLFLDAPYAGTVELCKETFNYLKQKNYQTVALYASVQFVNQLEKVRKQLEEAHIEVITSQARRTHVETQLLGCDNDKEALNLSQEQWQHIDAFLYIGDGRFHPLALVFAQKDLDDEEKEEGKERINKKEILCNDPMTQQLKIMGEVEVKSILNKYRASLMKFIAAERVGVLVTIKPGQQQLRASFAIEEKFPEKKFYYFIDNVLSFDQLENFPFIETWVNTACPRIGFDDQEKFVHVVINLRDAVYLKQ
ncbi:diphthamide synthesis protein [Candidatus Woesearchaeota archaeon]|nr:diphthamide synthesis protein [Candidatus Woesearchaeota archaeon]